MPVLKFFAQLALSVVVLLFAGVVLSVNFNWFIVPLFQHPGPIGVAHAIGLLVTSGTVFVPLLWRTSANFKETEAWVDSVGMAVLYALELLIGFFVYQWMP